MPPGPANPMGRVKVKFAPLYYLHGTPDTSSIGYARSHGCIRMRNVDAIDLARFLETFAAPERARAIDEILSGRATRSVHLRHAVPMDVIYDRLESTDTMITLHPDPYRVGAPTLGEAIAELQQGSAYGSVVDTVQLRTLLKNRQARRIVVPRESIIRAP